MKRVSVFLLGTLLLVFLASLLFTYQVAFDEAVVVTTFGKATALSVVNREGNQAGLHIKWPWPIQKVVRMDRRLFVLEDRLEQQETRDRHVIILKAFAVWQIDDPLDFHRAFHASGEAETFLRERLRAAKAEVSRFTFDDLTSPDPARLKIDAVQAALLTRVNADLDGHACGIKVAEVGISRILLPERITRSVFSRMKQTRQRLAQNARSEGSAMARRIVSETDSDRQRILAFAERVADSIRAEGDAAAAQYYSAYAEDPEFALFLRKLVALKKSLSKNTTFVLDTETGPFDLLKE